MSAIQHAQTRTLRAVEGHRDQLRSTVHAARLMMIKTKAMASFFTRQGAAAFSRRQMLALSAGAAAGALSGLGPRTAEAVLRLDVTQGNVQPIPIAIPEFLAVATADPASGRNISHIVSSNLQRSGLFAPIDPAAFIERLSTIDALPRFADWRAINAQALVTGRITQSDSRLKAEFRLWDVFAGTQLH